MPYPVNRLKVAEPEPWISANQVFSLGDPSEPDRVTIDAVRPEVDTGARPVVTREQSNATPVILVVDDDPTTVRLLVRVLRAAGMSTLAANTLAEADQHLKQERVSLLLLDVFLPDGNGLEWCSRNQGGHGPAGLPVLFISGATDEKTKLQGFAAGAVDYITKPLATQEVLARVRTHLRLQKAYETLADLQAERFRQLAETQQLLMPAPDSLSQAKFHATVRQILGAGGDFYDVFISGGQSADYLVADASGHNLGASLWTASFKALLTEYGNSWNTPREIFELANRTLLRVLPESAFFTAIYARVNREFGTLTLVNAAHPPALLCPEDGGPVQVLEQQGDVLGTFDDAMFGVLERNVCPGDRVFLYSDGLIELAGSRTDGIAHLAGACRRQGSRPLAEAIPAIIDEHCRGIQPDDDIVLLGFQV